MVRLNFDQWVTFIILFGLTWVVWPFSISPFELPKVWLFLLLVMILVVYQFIKVAKEWPKISIFQTIPRWKWVAFLGVLGICYVHLFAGGGGWGNQYRPQGELIYLALAGWFLFSEKLNLSLKTWGNLGLFSLVGLAMSAVLIGPREGWRFVGFFGEPNSLAAASLFYLGLTMYLSGYRRWIGVLLATSLVLASGSRGGVYGLILMMFFWIGWKWRWWRWSMLGISIVGFVLLTILVLRVGDLTLEKPGVYQENRAEIWKVSWEIGVQNPLFGVGFENFEKAFKDRTAETNKEVQFLTVDSAHNIWLQWWASGGLLGVFLLTWLVVRSGWEYWNTDRTVWFISLIGLLAVQFFTPVSIGVLAYFWWILAGISPKDQVSIA